MKNTKNRRLSKEVDDKDNVKMIYSEVYNDILYEVVYSKNNRFLLRVGPTVLLLEKDELSKLREILDKITEAL